MRNVKKLLVTAEDPSTKQKLSVILTSSQKKTLNRLKPKKLI